MSRKTPIGDYEYEKPLQAILLAESFNDCFSPLTYEMPLALMPLDNVPMIDYTIQWLSTQGVKEIFIAFKHFNDQFEDHFKSSNWKLKSLDNIDNSCESNEEYPIIYLVPMKNISCQVDILKEMYERNLITSDLFLILTGMNVMNFELKSILDLHKERHNRDSNSIITSIFKKASAVHPIHSLHSDLILLTDKKTKQILGYDNDINANKLSLNNIDIYTCPQIEAHNDLYDTYIDICSTEVLLKLVEINDYRDYHEDFLQDEINHNILGTRYYMHVLNSSYSGYIQDIRSYAQISRDILRRWTYPYTPEAPFSHENQICFTDQRIYYSHSIKKDYDTFIGPETLIGANTKLISNCHCESCVIGHDNSIDGDCVIQNCILWNKNTIGRNTTIKNSLIANNVSIGRHCTIINCMLGSHVIIGDNVILMNKKVYRNDLFSAPDDEASVDVYASGDLGVEGKGCVSVNDIEMDIHSEEIEQKRIAVNKIVNKDTLKGTVGFEKDNVSVYMETDMNKEKRFRNGIQEFIEECIYEKADINDTLMQMNCFKMAENKNYEDVLNATIPCILNTTDLELIDSNINEYKKSTRLLLSKYETLIKRNVLDDKNRLSIIRSLEDYVTEENKKLFPLFGFFLETFLNQNFINSQNIIEWSEEIKEKGDSHGLLKDEKVQSILSSILASSMRDSYSGEEVTESEYDTDTDSDSDYVPNSEDEDTESDTDSSEDEDEDTESDTDSSEDEDEDTESDTDSSEDEDTDSDSDSDSDSETDSETESETEKDSEDEK